MKIGLIVFIFSGMAAAQEFYAKFEGYGKIDSSKLSPVTYSCFVKGPKSRYQILNAGEDVQAFIKKFAANTSLTSLSGTYIFTADAGKSLYSVTGNSYQASGNLYFENMLKIENPMTFSDVKATKVLDKAETLMNFPVRHLQVALEYSVKMDIEKQAKMLGVSAGGSPADQEQFKKIAAAMAQTPPKKQKMVYDYWFATGFPRALACEPLASSEVPALKKALWSEIGSIPSLVVRSKKADLNGRNGVETWFELLALEKTSIPDSLFALPNGAKPLSDKQIQKDQEQAIKNLIGRPKK